MGLNGYTIMAQITVEEFRNFFKYYNGEEHQQRAVEQLYDDLKKKTKDDKAEWIVTYRTPKEEPVKKHLYPRINGIFNWLSSKFFR